MRLPQGSENRGFGLTTVLYVWWQFSHQSPHFPHSKLLVSVQAHIQKQVQFVKLPFIHVAKRSFVPFQIFGPETPNINISKTCKEFQNRNLLFRWKGHHTPTIFPTHHKVQCSTNLTLISFEVKSFTLYTVRRSYLNNFSIRFYTIIVQI